MPAVFVAHGSPMSAIEDNRYSAAWRELGATLPRPRAILAISAHWYGEGTAVTVNERPPTIHDFYGFPKQLYEIQYPAHGDPALAARVQQLLAPTVVTADDTWGLDHGTWSVLVHTYPAADIPIVQMRIDARVAPEAHYALGRKLSPLREEGVLILGSGNVVHNLRAARWQANAPAYDWAMRFDARVKAAVLARDHTPLLAAMDDDARRSNPTPDHYLPLLYCLGLQMPDEPVTIPIEGIELGAISMLSVRIG